MRFVALVLIAFFTAPVASAQACGTMPEGFLVCELPAAQRVFIEPLPLDCMIRNESAQSFTLRCRTDIGKEDKWIAGPKPVVHLPKLPKKRKRKTSDEMH